MHCADVRANPISAGLGSLSVSGPFALHRQDGIFCKQSQPTGAAAGAQLISFVELATEKSFMCAPRLGGSFKLM